VPCQPDNRLIILKPKIAENVAILVERGGDIARVPETCMEAVAPAPLGTLEFKSPFISHICKLETGLLMVVTATRFVDHVKQLMA